MAACLLAIVPASATINLNSVVPIVQMVMPTETQSLTVMSITVEPQILVAQKFKDTLGEDVAKAWNNFVDSGQLWALIIGLALGWVFGKLLNF